MVQSGKKSDEAGGVFHGVEATEGMFRANLFAPFVGERNRHARFQKAGQYHIAADIAWPILAGNTLCEADQSRFGRGVDALSTRAASGRPRSDQHDVAASLFEHDF